MLLPLSHWPNLLKLPKKMTTDKHTDKQTDYLALLVQGMRVHIGEPTVTFKYLVIGYILCVCTLGKHAIADHSS